MFNVFEKSSDVVLYNHPALTLDDTTPQSNILRYRTYDTDVIQT